MLEATPRQISAEISWEERVKRGKALILIGLLELFQIREELAAETEPINRLLGIRESAINISGVTPNITEDVFKDPETIRVLEPEEGSSIGRLVQRYRIEQAGLTQTQLARESRIDVSTLSRLESGRSGKSLRTNTLLKLARGFGWNEDDPRLTQLSRLSQEATLRNL